jgi:hypothetical protein
MSRGKGRRFKESCDRVWVEKYYPYLADYALEVCEQIKVPWTKIANRLKVIQKLSRTNQTDTGLNQLIVWGVGDLYNTIIHIINKHK